MIRYITFFILQLKNCLGCGRFIGYLSLRIVLSAKHLVSNKGHNYYTCTAATFNRVSEIL